MGVECGSEKVGRAKEHEDVSIDLSAGSSRYDDEMCSA